MCRWEEEKAYADDIGSRVMQRRQLAADARALEESFAAEDLALRKKGGRRNVKAEMAREAERNDKREELKTVWLDLTLSPAAIRCFFRHWHAAVRASVGLS